LGVGADPRQMDKPLDARLMSLARKPFCRFHMYRVERLGPTFAVQANGVHDRVRSGYSRCDRSFVVDVGAY
jgi:hypothetical protein